MRLFQYVFPFPSFKTNDWLPPFHFWGRHFGPTKSLGELLPRPNTWYEMCSCMIFKILLTLTIKLFECLVLYLGHLGVSETNMLKWCYEYFESDLIAIISVKVMPRRYAKSGNGIFQSEGSMLWSDWNASERYWKARENIRAKHRPFRGTGAQFLFFLKTPHLNKKVISLFISPNS